MRRRADLIAIGTLAAAAHALYFVCAFGDWFYPDSITYLIPARNLIHGLGFTTLGLAETLRTPGYPLFLAPFVAATNSVVPIVIVQHLLAVAVALGVYLAAIRLTGSRVAAIVAGVLFALDPATLHHANKVLSDTLFMACLFPLFLAGPRIRTPRHAALHALAAGALVLIRPVAILWFAIVALFLPRRLAAVYVACALALPLAWATRNRIETGVFTVSSVSGTNLLMYRAAGALAMLDGGDFRSDLADHQQEMVEDATDEIESTQHIPDVGELPHAVKSKYFARVARRVLAEHPLGALLITLYGLEVNLFDSDWDAIAIVTSIHPAIVHKALDAATAIEIALAVIGLIALYRRDRRLALYFALTIAYFVLISAGGESEARFRVPVVPLIAIGVGIALSPRA